MPPLSTFAGVHQGKAVLVLGTGPSAFDPALGHSERFLQLASSRLPIIGMNRAFDVHPRIKINYQVSIDRIWNALIKKKREGGMVWEQWHNLNAAFKKWQHQYGAEDWLLEDFAYAYQSSLKLHPEIWRLLRLSSHYAPFIRFSYANNSASCPYPSVRFNQAKKQDPFPHGKCVGNALHVGGNCAQTAIHLAHVMGGSPIFLLGVDLADADPKARPWEQGARYRYDRAHDPIEVGFRVVYQKIKHQTHLINLNPNTRLQHCERVKTVKEGFDRLEQEVKRAKYA